MGVSRYAKDTSVTAEKSRAELESLLRKYGADGFGYAYQGDRAMVEFTMADRRVRLAIRLPDPNDDEFWYTPSKGQKRDPELANKFWRKACRQSWRVLVLVVKAKLEAVESEVAEFDEEFLPYIVMPDGSTVGQHVIPAMQKAYIEGRVTTKLLPESVAGAKDE